MPTDLGGKVNLYEGKTMQQVLDDGWREEQYHGDSAPVAALCLEMGIEEREIIRRIGMGNREFREDWALKATLELIGQVAWENNQPGHYRFVRSFIIYNNLLAQDRLKEDEAVIDLTIEMLFDGTLELPADWPIEVKVAVAKDEARKKLGLGLESTKGVWGRPDNQASSVVDMTTDACNLITRGYPLAAWDILATTTREKRQEVLNELISLGMREEDWVYRTEGYDRCILCDQIVTNNNRAGVRGIDHTGHCPITNLDFGRVSWGELKLKGHPGIRKVPIVMDPYNTRIEEAYKT